MMLTNTTPASSLQRQYLLMARDQLDTAASTVARLGTDSWSSPGMWERPARNAREETLAARLSVDAAFELEHYGIGGAIRVKAVGIDDAIKAALGVLEAATITDLCPAERAHKFVAASQALESAHGRSVAEIKRVDAALARANARS